MGTTNITSLSGLTFVLGAIGPKELFSVLFVVIAFVSWIFNVIKANKEVPGGGLQPRPQGGRRVDNDLQAEINRFLNNAMGKNDDGELIEVLEEDESAPRRPTKSQRKSGKSQRQTRGQSSTPPLEKTAAASSRSDSRVSQRGVPGSRDLGSGVRQHLAEHMQDRMVKQAQDHFAHGVAEKVEHDLGAFLVPTLQRSATAAVITHNEATITASGVAEIVRNPATLKQAFVMNLVLTRPKFGRCPRNTSN